MLACSKIGAYFTLFNYAYAPAELLHAVKATTPKVLLATRSTCRFNYRDVLEDIFHEVPEVERVVLLRDATKSTTQQDQDYHDCTGKYINYEDLLLRGNSLSLNFTELEAHVSDPDILNLQFTSGSTGLPKVAALTHHGMANSSRYIGLKMNIKPSDKIIIPVPLFHAFGLVIGKTFVVLMLGVIKLTKSLPCSRPLHRNGVRCIDRSPVRVL